LLLAHATAFGDMAEPPIQKRWGGRRMRQRNGGTFARVLLTADAVFASAMAAPCLMTANMPSA
jgi:hypothetical protein